MKPFVDFYRANAISPVRQDIGDRDRHFQRREALYRHLGLVPAWLSGRSIVEFGPGSGYNALHTASLGPSRYLLVDGNPFGLAAARALLAEQAPDAQVDYVEALIEDFSTPERFDLVLCEGTIPFQIDPPDFLRRVASFTAPGGVVVTTCVDGVSMLAETVRRLYAMLLVEPDWPTGRKLARLLPVFSPHLATLAGMSRPHEDWILDQLVQPLTGRLLPIAEAVAALDGEFDVLGSSPRFLTDWRWYKDIHGEGRRYNELALEGYLRQVHNFVDYRIEARPRPAAENLALLALADGLFYQVQAYDRDRDPGLLDGIRDGLARLPGLCAGFSPPTAAAFEDAVVGLDALRRGEDLPALARFRGCFGRGQQYLSLLRR